MLALCIATSEAFAAPELVIGASANSSPPPLLAVNQIETSRHQNAGLGVRVAFQSGLTGSTEVRSNLPAAEVGPVAPGGVAKTSALVLSSLGMLGVISLLRLNRTL